MTKKPIHVIGVDAGGTKTHAVLVREDGHVVARGIGGPGNPTRVPVDRVRASLQEAIGATLAAANSPRARAVAAACLGVAGGRGYQEVIRGTVAGLGISGPIITVGDAEIAFWASIAGTFGVIVIAGTGSSAFGVGPDGATAKAGGRGYLVGDEGSAYDIGRSGIVAALMAEDGRASPTALLDQLMQYFHLDDVEGIVPAVYDPSVDSGRTRISGFAPLVVQAAAAGDRVALQIFRRAGLELGRTATAVARKLNLCERAFELALVGGVFQAGELVIAPLQEEILKAAPQASIFRSHTAPALGAARLALRAVGKDVGVQAGS